jgi:hypothetical protein
MIFTGGGGYTLSNVSWCWAYETSLIAKEDIGNSLPEEIKFKKYFDNNFLHFGDSETSQYKSNIDLWEYDKSYHPSYVVYNDNTYKEKVLTNVL